MSIENVLKTREEMLQRLYMYARENDAAPMPAGEFPDKIDDRVRVFNLYFLHEGGYVREEAAASGKQYRITAAGIQLYEELYGRYNI